MTVAELRKAMRDVDPNAKVILAAHDAVTGPAHSAYMIDEEQVESWSRDTATTDFNLNQFVISG